MANEEEMLCMSPLHTDSTSWMVAALIMSVPVTQIALSLLYPSSESPLAIVVGQGLGWMLGWLTRQLLKARYVLYNDLKIWPAGQGKLVMRIR